MIKNIARAQDQLLKKLKKTPSSSYFIFHQARVALLTAGETLLIGENHLKTICENKVYNGCQKKLHCTWKQSLHQMWKKVSALFLFGNQLYFTCTAGGSFLRTFSTSSLTFYQAGVSTLEQYGKPFATFNAMARSLVHLLIGEHAKSVLPQHLSGACQNFWRSELISEKRDIKPGPSLSQSSSPSLSPNGRDLCMKIIRLGRHLGSLHIALQLGGQLALSLTSRTTWTLACPAPFFNCPF